MSPMRQETDPNEHILGVLRRHRDANVRPDMDGIALECGLTAAQVQALWEKLLSGKRDAFRPPGGNLTRPRVPAGFDRPEVVLPIAPDRRPEVTLPAVDRWRQGVGHEQKAIARAAERVLTAIAAAEAPLDGHAEKERLRAREADLLEQLARVRAELTGGPVAGIRCQVPGCTATAATPNGLKIHHARKHKEES